MHQLVAAAKQVAAWEPEVLIITSPHQVMYADYFPISPGRGVTEDMSAFGSLSGQTETGENATVQGWL